MTYEELLNMALSRVPNDLDKREGSIIYNALAPCCFELAQAYVELETVRNITYADTSTGEDLTLRCRERGIQRKPSTKALRRGIFNINIPLSSRFSIENTTYIVKEKIEDRNFILECEQLGVIGNAYVGVLLPIDYIEGLTSANITEILVPGEDEETDESLRKRYFDSLESQAFGGNIADYKDKVSKINGVGGVKVYPIWNGGGTVKLVIIDSTFDKPSDTLVNEVQTIIDPVQNQGEGVGIAPIGHIVTVSGVDEIIINITSNITLRAGYAWDDVKAQIIDKLNEYYKELRESWESSDNLVVRISYIETRVLDVPGVLDIQGTNINGSAENLILGENHIPGHGDVINV